jgi:Fic family protein
MPYKENLKRATELKKELDSFRPLKPEVEKRITQKFRLDWNYHSSHIEGNQLTYGETKALILFGQTAQAKPLKDHLEMTGHDEAIKTIEEVIRQERPLTEHFIRELHEIILKEPHKVKAITPEGNPTQRTITVGQYKKTPNHVLTVTGEIFYFASPEETPAMMAELMEWYRERVNTKEIHPVLFATEFHYRFIRIHPFDDGNGRIARLLMNFILMQKGYPPSIIKTEDKENYFAALRQADAGQLEYFFNYVCEQVNRSLEMMIKGAKGESIDEDDDLDKKLALLEKELESEDEENKLIPLTYEKLNDHFFSWIANLLEQLIDTNNKFAQFYLEKNYLIHFYIDNDRIFSLNDKDRLSKFNKYWKNKYESAKYQTINKCLLNFSTHFSRFNKGGLNSFDCTYNIEIQYDQYSYKITINQFDQNSRKSKKKMFIKNPLNKMISNENIKQIIKIWGDSLFNHLDFFRKNIKENGN